MKIDNLYTPSPHILPRTACCSRAENSDPRYRRLETWKIFRTTFCTYLKMIGKIQYSSLQCCEAYTNLIQRICHKLWFFNLCNSMLYQLRFFKLWILINSSWKHKKFTTSGCKDIGSRKIVTVAKTQLIYVQKQNKNNISR